MSVARGCKLLHKCFVGELPPRPPRDMTQYLHKRFVGGIPPQPPLEVRRLFALRARLHAVCAMAYAVGCHVAKRHMQRPRMAVLFFLFLCMQKESRAEGERVPTIA